MSLWKYPNFPRLAIFFFKLLAIIKGNNSSIVTQNSTNFLENYTLKNEDYSTIEQTQNSTNFAENYSFENKNQSIIEELQNSTNFPDNHTIENRDHPTIEQYPHAVQLLKIEKDKYTFICGGAILRQTIILTAAKCIPEEDEGAKYVISVGTTLLSRDLKVPVKNILIHPLYNEETMDFDVAILELEQSLTYSPSIQPIAIISQLEATEHDIGTLIGWRQTLYENETATRHDISVLLVQVIPQDECKNQFPLKNSITDRMFCTSFIQLMGKNNGLCKGISGGPFTVSKKLYGIESWNKDCTDGAVIPGVFTRVSNPRIIDWIHEIEDKTLPELGTIPYNNKREASLYI